ncbi:cytochrome c oxidase subunit 6A1, mitochondrial [Xylocopa sonorina]|uniref:cytochrome c oxidase subunit 6A1, mitochondrial n=1 Tax=Xylocopa sonorina TaxID=1818115 RepID=UPI00403A813D
MARLLRGGQFARGFHTTARAMDEVVVQTVEQRSHSTGEASENLWKNISYFVGLPAIALSMLNVYLKHKEEEEHERPEFVPMPYLKIMNKPFPWGDGKHSLFHNPKVNYVPGIGWEE